MKNGKQLVFPDIFGKQPITTIFSDAVDTLFVPADGKSMAELTLGVANSVLEKEVNINPRAFEKELSRLRTNLALEGSFAPQDQSDTDYWGHVNAAVFNHFGYACTVLQGRMISLIARNEVWFGLIPPQRKVFFRELIRFGLGNKSGRRKCRAYVVSNATQHMVRGLLQRNRIGRLFNGVITPTEVFGLEKPSPGFFEEVLKRTGANPCQTLFLGNSFYKDLAGALLGMYVVWLDFRRLPIKQAEIARLYGKDAANRIFRVHNLVEAKQLIMDRFAFVGQPT